MASQNNKPVHEIRLGKVKAAIWRNETDMGPRYSVTIVRLYKIDGGNWESSTSFGRDELPLVGKVADLVHTWIYQQAERTDKGEKSEEQSRTSRIRSDRNGSRRQEPEAAAF